MKELNQAVLSWLEQHREEYLADLKELAQIPAPSHFEEKRAEWVKAWLERHGATGVVIDEAKNVIFPYHAEGKNDLCVFNAHLDVVFPDMEPLPFHEADGKYFAPGIGDDTANIIALLQMAAMAIEMNLQPKQGILFVFNSCEEGLGNLKGTRQLMKDYGDRIVKWFAIDGGLDSYINKAVGSKRYEITIETEGGHSYGAFGNRNAIHYMAKMIDSFYSLKVPDFGKTTYNVGVIEGGTTVNSIAQKCMMLYEYRSDDIRGMEYMDKFFDTVIEMYRNMGITVDVNMVGDRPCMAEGVDMAPICEQMEACGKLHGVEMTAHAGSTDCNIPHNMGIPAVCFGVYKGKGAHTREEWIDIESTKLGMKILASLIMDHMN